MMHLVLQRGRPQNPVTHEGSMTFSEHGRVAQMNPLVLLFMSIDRNGHRRTTDGHGKSFWVGGAGGRSEGGVAARILQEFSPSNTEQDAFDFILETAFLIAKVVYLSLKESLTSQEAEELPKLFKKQRNFIQKMFRTSKNFALLAECPNIHVATHWEQDIQNFGTTYNVSASIGEQTHRIHKAHAPHTNSRDTELQLMKDYNMSQTLRFVASGAYPDNHLAEKFRLILSKSPNMEAKLNGARTTNSDNVDYPQDEYVLRSLKLSKMIAPRSITAAQLSRDKSLLRPVFEIKNTPVIWHEHLRVKLRYYERLTLDTRGADAGGGPKIFSLAQGKPVQLQTDSVEEFAIVDSIIQLEGDVRTTNQIYLIVRPMLRDRSLDPKGLSYAVFTEQMSNNTCVALEEVCFTNVHMVTRDPHSTHRSWWLNPFVTRFL